MPMKLKTLVEYLGRITQGVHRFSDFIQICPWRTFCLDFYLFILGIKHDATNSTISPDRLCSLKGSNRVTALWLAGAVTLFVSIFISSPNYEMPSSNL